MDGIERCKAQLKEIDEVEELKLSRLIDLKSLPPAHEIDKLLKYEGTIEKQLYRAINQLERLQRMRQGEAIPLPINLNIDSEK
jgi:CRISPR/Cas system-associated endonuclease Cas1